MAVMLLLLSALVLSASGQQCSYSGSTDCATCIGDTNCAYFASCGFCTSAANAGTCNGEPPTQTPSSCPVSPTAAEAVRPLSSPYWLVCLGVLAAGVTAVLAYAPLEHLSGRRWSPPRTLALASPTTYCFCLAAACG